MPQTGSSTLDESTRQLPDGFYSTFRTYEHGTRAIGLKQHLARLFKPVKNAKVTEAEFRRQLRELLKEYPNEARVRIIMTRNGQAYIAVEPLKPLPREVHEKGVRVKTIELSREAPRLKSTAFIEASREGRRQIAQEGIFEALLVKSGRILEGMTSNFFYVVNEVLYTASHGVLPGVTRGMVIRAARGRGLRVEYKSLKQDQLKVPNEAFLTSSSRGVVPVIQIDDVRLGEGRPGRITRLISSAYEEFALKKAELI